MKLAINLLAVTAILCPAVATAQDSMSAKDVISKYIKASGGKENYDKVKSYSMKAKFIMAAAGLEAPVTSVGTMKPLRQLQTVDLGQFGGKMDRFYTPKASWESSAMQGQRLFEGVEKAQAMRDANLIPEVIADKYYKAMKVVGKEEVGGEECYKVELTPKVGKPEMSFYSTKTGLKLKSVQTVVSPQGEIKAESMMSDYRKVGDLMLPFKTEQKMSNGMTFLIKVEKFELNKAVPDSTFAVPAKIEEMAKKAADKAKAGDKAK